jgi:methionyl-tRNA formyltransferase
MLHLPILTGLSLKKWNKDMNEAKTKLRVVFMGSDSIACPALETLCRDEGIEIIQIITQPDRPKGRRRRLAPCDLKAKAVELELPVSSPEKIGEGAEEIAALEPDLIVVVAYGQYIPGKVLEIPPLGAINLHPSLLPKYRGASPIQEAVAHGETETGVTILYVSREMDAGDILAQKACAIDPEENALELGQRLAHRGAELLLEVVGQLRDGTAHARPQDDALATYVHKIAKEDGRIDWTQDARTINNRIRGYQPWPVCYTDIPVGENEKAPLRIYRAAVVEELGTPGEVLCTKGDGPVVAAGKDALQLLDVQPPGKKRMSGRALVCGRYLQDGMRLTD